MPGSRWHRAQAAISSLWNAPTRLRRILTGRPSRLSSTAATNGVLPGAPRPRLPPRRSPPQYASSSCTQPPKGRVSSRSFIAFINLCLTLPCPEAAVLEVADRAGGRMYGEERDGFHIDYGVTNLPHALARDPEMARRRALAHPVPARQTHLAIQPSV